MNAQTTISVKEMKPEYIQAQHSVADLFGLESEAAKATFLPTYSASLDGYKPFVPAVKNHHFESVIFNDLREFEASGFEDGALFITGPAGIGKSTSVEQYYSRTNKPVFRVTGHERLEVSDLLGTMSLKDGKTVFTYGPLTLAALWGGVFLFDEADACPPEVLVGLHGILEMGDQFVIPENESEIIPIKKGFRVVVTGNTAGGGDMEGQYAGTVTQNSATLDRFNFLEWSYPSKEVELKILRAATKGVVGDAMLERLVDAANMTRIEGGVESLSIRSLIRWARKITVYRDTQSLKYSLDRSFTFRLSESKRNEVYAVMKTCFGEREFFGS